MTDISTGYSPAMLHLGRRHGTRLDLLKTRPKKINKRQAKSVLRKQVEIIKGFEFGDEVVVKSC